MNGDGDGITRLRQLRWALNGNGLVVLTRPVSAAPGGQLVRHRLTVHIVGDAGELLDEREFMPTAQRFGLALEVDRQVIRQAVGIAARGCAIEIGLAVETLADPDLLALVEHEIGAAGTDPSLLYFEITGDALDANRAMTEGFIDRVRLLGCEAAVEAPWSTVNVAVS